MNKEEFNQLGIIEQMTYINDLLKTMSLTKACDSIGIDRATVRKRFKSKEISFNKELNQYVFDVPYEKYDVKPNTEPLDAITTTYTTITTENRPKPIKRAERKDTNLDSIKLLEKKIKTLESQLEATNKRIDDIVTTKTTITTEETPKDSTIRKYDGEEVVRSFRVNEDVQKRFKAYCKSQPEHKVSDILSTILDDFLSDKMK